ncbi:hypothetical protein B0H17DRAFT_1097015 [Mycena rosella]|uniref:Uncharacterized protein n=1 Tax=Mycena rosella TaxID=1033263 RepID=A0AAD7G5Q0_MYCRO|nr:hypothetical protein B0H17DRAFT_1097015 [Mycena rosella]
MGLPAHRTLALVFALVFGRNCGTHGPAPRIPLKSLSKLYIRPFMGAVEDLLRELVGPPDEDCFDCSPCKTGQDHCFILNTGYIFLSCLGTWEVHCLAHPDKRCPTQRGIDLPPDQVKRYDRLITDYRARNGAVNWVLQGLQEAKAGMVELFSLGESTPALPKLSAEKMSQTLECIRDYADQVDWRFLPDDPDVLVLENNETQQKGKGKEVKPSRISSAEWEGDIFEKNEDSEAESLDPEERQLSLVMPKAGSWDGVAGIVVHVTVCAESRRPPFHILCWAPSAACFDLRAYEFVDAWPGATFLAYCVKYERYESADGGVNMAGRGKLMVYRKSDVYYSDCPRIEIWEARARESAGAECGAEGTAPHEGASSSRLNYPAAIKPAVLSSKTINATPALQFSSSPARPASPRRNAVASSSMIDVNSAVPASKRKAEVLLDSTAKRVKADVAGLRHKPLSVSSSPRDVGVDSDVEFVSFQRAADSDIELTGENWSELGVAASSDDMDDYELSDF